MIKRLEVGELLELIFKRYDSEIEKANKEIQVLSAYREFVEDEITDKNLLENYLQLKEEFKALEKEVMSWRENGTPF
ncbi:hypothetical protein PBV87_08675 [Niameybacter massiliensis]|uniref:Uncharacterized protein n=1 Tax=Holtiella tumoricola TaxID=3018743 RepID=A0AA42DML0_9FIRM|nr:hypothetical protein [Holtiella tumoricola]MDA3731546.1 hypothetical protein [Holtiella tumoricola]